MSDIEALHLACAFDMRVPEPRLTEVQQLVALINEQMWIGHFDVWMQNGVVMFRHALLLAGGVRRLGPAMRGGARYRARCLRTLFPGVPVRGLGGQIGARSDGLRDVRDLRRGVTEAGAGSEVRDFSGPLVLSAPARWAAPCSKAGCGSASIRRRIAVIEPQPSPEIAALADRGVRVNPDPSALGGRRRHRRCGEAASRGAGGAGARAADRRVDGRGLDHGRADAAIPRRARSTSAGALVRAMPNTPAAIGRGITVAVPRKADARSARSPTGCWPRPERSSGSTTRR